ncbi:reverse transcriptase domain-containing protein [Tanacetum coccineum]
MEELPHVLWAHRTMIKSSNEDTPFSLTYRTEAVIPAEIGMPTIRTTKVDQVQNNEALQINLDLLEERREEAAIREARSKAKMEKYYNAKVRNTSFKPGDLVYHNNDASRAEDTGNLGPKWEGPYEVTKALGKGAITDEEFAGSITSLSERRLNFKQIILTLAISANTDEGELVLMRQEVETHYYYMAKFKRFPNEQHTSSTRRLKPLEQLARRGEVVNLVIPEPATDMVAKHDELGTNRICLTRFTLTKGLVKEKTKVNHSKPFKCYALKALKVTGNQPICHNPRTYKKAYMSTQREFYASHEGPSDPATNSIQTTDSDES